MKRTFFTMVIAGALVIVGLNACTKQDYSPVASTTPPPAQQAKLNLVASEWIGNGDGVYVNVFKDILSNLAITSGDHVSVYVEENGQETLITPSPIIFKGHALWATTTAHDLILSYGCADGPMPFQTLHIEVLVN
jgi:hypothetical protein